MSANLLTLNSAKTEFLLVGLKYAIRLSTLLTRLATSTYVTKSQHCLNLVIPTFANFAAYVLTLIPKQPVKLSIIATSTVPFKLDHCNSLYYNLPKSEIHTLQPIQNSLARLAREF